MEGQHPGHGIHRQQTTINQETPHLSSRRREKTQKSKTNRTNERSTQDRTTPDSQAAKQSPNKRKGKAREGKARQGKTPHAPLEEQAGEEGEDVFVAETPEQRFERDRAPRHRLVGGRAREPYRRVAHVVQHLGQKKGVCAEGGRGWGEEGVGGGGGGGVRECCVP